MSLPSAALTWTLVSCSVRTAGSGGTPPLHITYKKCNRLHKLEHYCHFAWCCKANFKINSPCLKTKQGEPCSHSFKYINCKGNHQADSNSCPLWHRRFNKEWHTKKYQELCDSKAQSFHSVMNSSKQWLSKILRYSCKTCRKTASLSTQF